MLITLSGLDGAGKSTLIDRLKTALEERKISVAVVHMTTDIGVYSCLRAIRDLFLRHPPGTNGAPKEPWRRSHAVSSAARRSVPRSGWRALVRRVRDAVVWNKPLRRCIYLVDLAIFMCYRVYIERVRRQVIIMDRYFYDTLVDVSDDGVRYSIRILAALTPTPTMPILLAVGPEDAFARKGEYSVEYLKRRWRAYTAIFLRIPRCVVLRNDDVASTARTLEQMVLARLGTPAGHAE
jgi:thymidylate kinase